MRFLNKIFSLLAFCILIINVCFSQTEYANSPSNTNVIIINPNDSNRIHKDSLIAYTIIKGIITAETPSIPIKAKISLIDKDEPTKIKYKYNSNEKTGKYLMILTPGKEYDLIIEAKGFKAHYISIYLPKQTYYYELYQEIHLTSVYLEDNNSKIGEEIYVNNIFSDVMNKKYESNKDTIADKDYNKLIEVIEKMIVESDSVALKKLELLATTDKVIDTSNSKNYSKLIELIRNAIESTDTTSLNILNNSTIFEEKTNHTYFFNDESPQKNMTMLVFGKDTMWVLPKMNTNKNINSIVENTYHKHEISKRYLFFAIGSTTIEEIYFDNLNDIASLLRYNKNLKIEINGYTDNIGNKESNLTLSKNRADSVKAYFISQQISENRIITIGKGVLNGVNDSEKCRKVEMILYE